VWRQVSAYDRRGQPLGPHPSRGSYYLQPQGYGSHANPPPAYPPMLRTTEIAQPYLTSLT